MTHASTSSIKAVNEILETLQPQFGALVNQTYYLYQREDETFFVSLVEPQYWGPKSPPLVFVSEVVYNEDSKWRKS